MNLAGLQQSIRRWLETGDADYVTDLGGAARPGLNVYLNNYRTQLLHCLDQVFPHTRSWLGSDQFHSGARCHIMSTPPVAWTLDAYPASFAAEVSTLFPEDAVAPELAELELALSDAQTAADRLPLTRDMFTGLDWESVAVTHASGGQILRHTSNAAQIWSALSRAESPPAAKKAESPVNILVWRSRWDPCFRVLDADEADIFAQMNDPLPFTDICEQLEQKHGAQAGIERAGLLLARWADDHAISLASTTLPRHLG